MEICESEVKMGESPNLGPALVTMGSRIVPLKPKQAKIDPILEELQKVRALLEHIDGNINYLTRPSWWGRLIGRIKSWVA